MTDFHLVMGVNSIKSESAKILSVLNTIVSILAPIGSPRVLDLPVGLGTLLSVSDHQDSMIQITGRASTIDVALRRVHTSDVVLHGCRIDSDRDRSDLGQSSLDRRLSFLRLRNLSPSLDVRKIVLRLGRLASHVSVSLIQ